MKSTCFLAAILAMTAASAAQLKLVLKRGADGVSSAPAGQDYGRPQGYHEQAYNGYGPTGGDVYAGIGTNTIGNTQSADPGNKGIPGNIPQGYDVPNPLSLPIPQQIPTIPQHFPIPQQNPPIIPQQAPAIPHQGSVPQETPPPTSGNQYQIPLSGPPPLPLPQDYQVSRPLQIPAPHSQLLAGDLGGFSSIGGGLESLFGGGYNFAGGNFNLGAGIHNLGLYNFGANDYNLGGFGGFNFGGNAFGLGPLEGTSIGGTAAQQSLLYSNNGEGHSVTSTPAPPPPSAAPASGSPSGGHEVKSPAGSYRSGGSSNVEIISSSGYTVDASGGHVHGGADNDVRGENSENQNSNYGTAQKAAASVGSVNVIPNNNNNNNYAAISHKVSAINSGLGALLHKAFYKG